MSLPFLPGYHAGETQVKSPKTQTLVYKNGYAMPKSPTSSNKPNSPHSMTYSLNTKSPTTSRLGTTSSSFDSTNGDSTFSGFDPNLTYPVLKKDYRYTDSKTPSLIKPVVKAEKPPHQTLSFEAYFIEKVADSRLETERCRVIAINFFLEDGTILISEKKSPNSGIPQGVLLKRQKVPKSDGTYYTVKDFNIGYDIEIYSRMYHITNCDQFTKNHMEKIGVALNEPEIPPHENYSDYRASLENHERSRDRPSVASVQKGLLKKFLDTDGQVLRFYCFWDNRDNLFGERRPYILHYFLVDDTVEVREVQTPNSGHHSFSVFLKRQKLPKKGSKSEFIKPKDLAVGGEVDVFGRTFALYDCDTFTVNYYKNNFNIQFEPFQTDFDIKELTKTASQVKVPSEQIQYKKKFQQVLDNDGKILRFSATMESMRPEDRERIFVASYYLADDTIGIYEPPQRNSGINGGKFLERMQIVNPMTGQNYKSSDFYVGSLIEVFSHRFILHDADEYAFRYMEENKDNFPHSDIDIVLDKIRLTIEEQNVNVEDYFRAMDRDDSGYISIEEFRALMIEQGFHLTEQEIITLVRRFDINRDSQISYPEFIDALNR